MQKTYWWSRTSCRKIWWLDNIGSWNYWIGLWISKTIIDLLWWCKTWQLNGFNIIRAKNKLHRKQKGACESSWNLSGNQKAFTLTTPLEFGKACEDLSWNHCTSTPHRWETNGIAERAGRRIKEEMCAVFLQSGLDENWWADSMECYCQLRNIQDRLSDGKTPNDVLVNHLRYRSFHLVLW